MCSTLFSVKRRVQSGSKTGRIPDGQEICQVSKRFSHGPRHFLDLLTEAELDGLRQSRGIQLPQWKVEFISFSK